jgi:hypothetical protein
MAEAAGERAADLGGDAERAAILLRDMDRLGLLPVGEPSSHLRVPSIDCRSTTARGRETT